MKRKLLSAALAALLPAGASQAAVLFYDGFDYTAGEKLAPRTDTVGTPTPGQLNVASGFNWRYAGAGGVVNEAPGVSSGSLSYPQFAASTGNGVAFDTSQIGSARIQINPTALNTGTVYWSALLNLTTLGTLTSGVNGMMLGGFNNAVGPGTLPTTVGAVLRIRKDAVGNVYYIGTGMNSGTGTGAGGTNVQFDNATPHSEGETVLVVGAYEFVAGATNDKAYMWINPNPATWGAAVPPTPTLTSAPGVAIADSFVSLSSFNLRNVNTVGNPAVLFDELRVGDDWASVAPEPSSLALLGVAGISLLRRRRV